LECTAPSDHCDVVVDRAAMSSLTAADMERALVQVRRILKPGGLCLFNLYGERHTRPFSDHIPPQTLWSTDALWTLFADGWEFVESSSHPIHYLDDPEGVIEHTYRNLVRSTS
jgi:SAM-dependent methyltransferase